jgi:hypothetical protein
VLDELDDAAVEVPGLVLARALVGQPDGDVVVEERELAQARRQRVVRVVDALEDRVVRQEVDERAGRRAHARAQQLELALVRALLRRGRLPSPSAWPPGPRVAVTLPRISTSPLGLPRS